MRPCIFCSLFFIVFGSFVEAQETFVYQLGGPAPGQWESSGNWSGGSGSFSAWPGESPEIGTLDSANLAAAHPANYSINITTPGLTLDKLTLGSSSHQVVTTITGSPGATLSANEIRTGNSNVNAHQINVDFVMPSIELELADSGFLIPINFNGQFLNLAPTANTYRIVDNQSRRAMTVNGNIVLSDTVTAGHLLFRNGGLPAFTTINGVIEDGTAPGGGVSYVRGRFVVTNANTYSGETVIGANSPDAETQVEIHHDLAFGTGRVTAGGGNEERTLIAIGGSRTLANEIRLARDMQFAGTNSFTLNGQVFQSNSRRMINDLPIGKSLTINGDIYAADDNTSRPWTFAGTGRTTVNGSIFNSLVSGTASGSLVKSGSGILELNSESFYVGNTSVNAGTLVVNNSTGSATGTGNVIVNAVLAGSGSIAGIVNVNSGGQVRPGNSLGQLQVGGLNLNLGSTLQVELAGTGGIPGVDFDQLIVNGSANLAGSLSIVLTNGIAPKVSDVFTVFQSHALTGELLNVPNGERLATMDGIGSFLVNYSDANNAIMLTEFQATLSADFDRDGDVDDIDLQLWQTSYDINGLADADGDGDSDGRDFLIWQQQAGSTIFASLSAIPEPTGLTLCLTVVILRVLSPRSSRVSRRRYRGGQSGPTLHHLRAA